MNQKITMSSLVALLALKSGLSKDKSEEFLKEFFKLISENLRQGESVRLKSLGTFKIMTVETRKSVNVTNGEEIVIPEHKRIVFVPSRDVAEAVNAPFSMFDSVELHPDAEAELEKAEAVENPVVETVVQPEVVAQPEAEAEKIQPEEALQEVEETSQEVETEIQNEASEESSSESQLSEEETSDSNDSASSDFRELEVEAGKRKGRMRFIMGFVSGLVLAMLIGAAGYYYFFYHNQDEIKEKEEVAPPVVVSEVVKDSLVDSTVANQLLGDSIKIEEKVTDVAVENQVSEGVDTKPSDKVIKDVIGPKNYLTTMAQRHYGNFNLWAYIYEENKSFLGHPDRIKPGTEVVVPPLSKYGIDPKNPADIKKAKRLGVEIYNRFK